MRRKAPDLLHESSKLLSPVIAGERSFRIRRNGSGSFRIIRPVSDSTLRPCGPPERIFSATSATSATSALSGFRSYLSVVILRECGPSLRSGQAPRNDRRTSCTSRPRSRRVLRSRPVRARDPSVVAPAGHSPRMTVLCKSRSGSASLCSLRTLRSLRFQVLILFQLSPSLSLSPPTPPPRSPAARTPPRSARTT